MGEAALSIFSHIFLSVFTFFTRGGSGIRVFFPLRLYLAVDLLGTAHLPIDAEHLHLTRCRHVLEVAVYRLVRKAGALRNVVCGKVVLLPLQEAVDELERPLGQSTESLYNSSFRCFLS